MDRASLLVVALALCAPTLRAEDVSVVVETADGSTLPGTTSGAAELVLVEGGAQVRLALRDVRLLAVSTFREQETAALEAAVRGLRDRLCHDEVAVREAASAELLALPGAAAPFLAQLERDHDPEVRLRVRVALEALTHEGERCDSRDLVVLEKRVARGWLRLERLELTTALGPVTLERSEIRTVRSAAVTDDLVGELLLPPLARRPVKLPLQVVVTLRGGARLVGLVAADALALLDEGGKRLCSDGLESLTRVEGASLFEAQRAGVPPFQAALATKELVLGSGSRSWKVPAAAIESLTVGAAPGCVGGGSLPALVRALQKGQAPKQRFWVHINDQPANPWNSGAQMGMTWRLLDVKGKAALVGADDATNAYRGDTSLDEKLPILCVRAGNLPAPQGIDGEDFYHGWTGFELRLTRPVAGTELTSLEAANAIIRAQFGDGWEMAEHHSPQGGWHWWGWWTGP